MIYYVLIIALALAERLITGEAVSWYFAAAGIVAAYGILEKSLDGHR